MNNKIILKTICVIVIISSFAEVIAQSYFYYSRGNKIYLDEVENFSSTIKYKKAHKVGIGLYLLETNNEHDISVKSNFKKQKDTKVIYPLYKTINGDTVGVYDEIVLIPKLSTSRSDIDNLNKIYKSKVTKTNSLYMVVNVPKKYNIFEIANIYYETGLFKSAQPNFLAKVEHYRHIPNDEFFNKQFTLHNTGQIINDGRSGNYDADIDAPEAWDITKGSADIIVAVIDDGVTKNHRDLPSSRQVRLDGSNSFVSPKFDTDLLPNPNDPSPLEDDSGHGNSCAGAIAATIDNSIGIAGVAPYSKIMPVRINFSNAPVSSSQNIVDAIKFAVDNKADIISCSWGGSSESDITNEVLQFAVDSGVVIVFAASNSASHIDNNPGEVKYPSSANIPSLITVGATDRYDKQTNYSPTSDVSGTYSDNLNRIIDVSAPSHRAYPREIYDCMEENYPYIYNEPKGLYNEAGEIWTIDTPGYNGYNPSKGYTTFPLCADIPHSANYELPSLLSTSEDHLSYTGLFGGTSHATPVVAGVAALVLSINPDLSPLQVFDILTKTADKVGGYYYNTDGWSKELGYGRVNAYAAVVAAQNSLPPAPPVPPDCPDNITLPNTTISSGATETHQASNTIENSTTYIIEDGGTVILKGNEIILNPGFEAEEGSTFEATVDPCE